MLVRVRLPEASGENSTACYGRVAKLLLDFSVDENGVRVIRRKVTKQDMAKMVGASREMVSRVMKDLERSGYIRVEEGCIVLTED